MYITYIIIIRHLNCFSYLMTIGPIELTFICDTEVQMLLVYNKILN